MKRKFIYTASILILSGLGCLIGYLIIEKKINEESELLDAEVASLFDGKDAIIDGNFIGAGIIVEDTIENFYALPPWQNCFTVYELIKEDGGFLLKKTTPGNLTIYAPKKRKNIWGEWETNRYRMTVNEYYLNGFDYLTQGNEGAENFSYTPGKYHALSQFPNQFQKEYWSIGIKIRPGKESIMTYTGGFGDANKESHFIETHSEHSFYGKLSNDDIVKKSILIYCAVGAGIGFAISLILIIFLNLLKPFGKKATHDIFSHKWRSELTNEILYIEQKGLRKLIVTIVQNNLSKRGRAIIDKTGRQLNFRFENEEHFYQIEELNSSKLILKNLVSNELSTYYKM